MTSNFQWQGLAQSYDLINRCLQLSQFNLPRKLNALRHTHASVSSLGHRVYAIWAPGSTKVYVGMTGGTDGAKFVFERFCEHVLFARDWPLLDKHSRHYHLPLYAWINTVGIDNVIVTPLQCCSSVSVHRAETKWMHVLGLTNLLNRKVPCPGNEKWRWLYTIKNALKLHGHSATAPTGTLRQWADKYVRGLRSNLTLDQKLSLLLDTQRYLDHGISSQVSRKVRAQIQRDTGHALPPALVLRLPLRDSKQRRFIFETLIEQLQEKTVPAPYKEYVRRITRVIQATLPKCGSLFRSFHVKGSTDTLYINHVQRPVPCERAGIHKTTGVTLVKGHILTRDFQWVQRYNSSADPSVFSQCLKNAMLPPWQMINASVLQSLQRTLVKTPGLPENQRQVITARVMAYVHLFYEATLADTPRIYRQTYISPQVKKLPPNIVHFFGIFLEFFWNFWKLFLGSFLEFFGFFDKGATVLWATCPNLFVPFIFKSFFQSLVKYNELLQCDTMYNAGPETFSRLTGALSRYYLPRKRKHPTPRSVILQHTMDDTMRNQGTVVSHQYKVSNAFMNLIEQSLRAAGRKYNTFVRKHERTAPEVYKVATLTDRLTKGLKRKRAPQDTLEVPSCASISDPVTRRRFTPLPFHLMTLVALFVPSKRVRYFACLTKQF